MFKWAGWGALEFSSGLTGADTNLYRSAANELKTDDNLVVAGTLTVGGAAITPVYGRLFLSAAGGWPSTTSGCAANAKTEMATNKENFYTLDFDASAIEYAEWTVAMPPDWNGGTITGQFYWMHPATTTNFGVVWDLYAVAFGNDDTGDASFGSGGGVVDTGGTTNDIYISDASAAVTVAGTPAANDLVQFRVDRNATHGSDTMAVDAKLLGVMVTYTRV
jgi:hypothetical protein